MSASPSPTFEQAAARLGSWLDDPTDASTPPLLAASSKIVIHDRMTNPMRGGKNELRKHTVKKADDLRKRVLEIVASHQKEPLTVDPVVTCDGTCCSFDDPDLWGGATLVHLNEVCMSAGPDGGPTAYTSVHLQRMGPP